MKNLAVVVVLSVGFVFSVPAQGLIDFFNLSPTSISTNSTPGGAATGFTSAVTGQYYFALYISTNATSVNGQIAAISGNDNGTLNYAFKNTNWTLVAYGESTFTPGHFSAINPGPNGTVATGVAAGESAQFVVIGWSANIGTNIAAVQSWYFNGYPLFPGWIGQSQVSGALTLSDGETPATLFNTSSPYIPGFVIGEVQPGLWEPAHLVFSPANLTVTAGSTAIFSALGAGDLGLQITGQWLMNSNNLQNSYNCSTALTNFWNLDQGENDGLATLTITNVQMTNAEYYAVYMSNGAGSFTTSYALLTVLPPSPQTVINGNNLQISWPTAAGTFHVRAATNLAGPWIDPGLTINSDGTTSSVSITTTNQSQFFRLVYP